ncbi:uncharacterized protein LACBIDRAFT_325752 [Laccaria bicolor S238N-H82]|uniref:guanosine-diphosphatase n=1 Tax=Laccaria bicolor (strain S238N-H82 / ATCC MYA-4686) TaxID=486041 RepID=B0D641_LACBS|nr:uncharacterized protein LACBIDRAFT_325752 [Laccaria bicolor S238N-H82]EDR10133.1 predicted protein [Laccaria bicolor S238N-H82]|eukprot:XP_001879518.1 predicted protein [Laccaria bicolor S238N-H82]
MSGQTPRHAFMVPQAPAEDCRIEVPQDAVDALRNTIPVSRDEAMRSSPDLRYSRPWVNRKIIQDPPATSYVVIVDAGSSGTRPYIYKCREHKAVPGHFESSTDAGTKISLFYNAKVTEVVRDNGTGAAGKENQGIHNCFREGGEDANQRKAAVETYLGGLLTEVKEILEKQGVTGDALKDVSFFFYGTGGVRTLSPTNITDLYEVVKAIILDAGFGDLKNPRLDIDGAMEAKFGWVAANYSQGYPVSDYRVYVEMGGASAQIAIPVPLYQDVALVNEKERAMRSFDQAAAGRCELELLAASAYVEALEPGKQLIHANKRADDINNNQGKHMRIARVEPFGGRNVFLASFPMGVDEGYERYKKALPALINAPDYSNAPTLRDPSRRYGYEKDIDIEFLEERWTKIEGTQYRNGGANDTEAWVTEGVKDAILASRTRNDDDTIAPRELTVPLEIQSFRNLLGLDPVNVRISQSDTSVVTTLYFSYLLTYEYLSTGSISLGHKCGDD